MDDFVRVIFQNAIMREKKSKKMYLDLVEKSKLDSLKQLFQRLADEEDLHERLFSKMNLEVLRVVNTAPLSKLNLLKSGLVINKEKESIISVIRFAISEEKRAYYDYVLMSKYINSENVKETLNEMAEQELRHQVMLENAILELNQNEGPF